MEQTRQLKQWWAYRVEAAEHNAKHIEMIAKCFIHRHLQSLKCSRLCSKGIQWIQSVQSAQSLEVSFLIRYIERNRMTRPHLLPLCSAEVTGLSANCLTILANLRST